MSRKISFLLNKKVIEIKVSDRMLLVDLLREELHLTGTHVGCAYGVCGACTVLIDGVAIRSCLTFAPQVDGSEVETVEGLSDGEIPSPIQIAMSECRGLQCGFCTPGMLTRAYRFLHDNPNPTEEEIRVGMSGNLCRCTGYQNIVKAVQYAANKLREDAKNPVAA